MSGELSWQELVLCADVGARRQIAAFAQGRKSYGNQNGDEPLFENHIAGAIAEFHVARHFNLFWSPSIGEVDSTDVGGLLEVRMRKLPGTGSDLAIRPKDIDDKPYVLVHVHRLTPWQPKIVGWLFGGEGKRPSEPTDPLRGVWYIPPPYRPVSELEEWVRTAICGEPIF